MCLGEVPQLQCIICHTLGLHQLIAIPSQQLNGSKPLGTVLDIINGKLPDTILFSLCFNLFVDEYKQITYNYSQSDCCHGQSVHLCLLYLSWCGNWKCEWWP